jgi:hypothetical protein
VSKSQKDEPFPPFNIRMSEDVARNIRVDAAKHDLKHGEFITLLYAFGKKNGFLEWLRCQHDKS